MCLCNDNFDQLPCSAMIDTAERECRLNCIEELECISSIFRNSVVNILLDCNELQLSMNLV